MPTINNYYTSSGNLIFEIILTEQSVGFVTYDERIYAHVGTINIFGL